VPIADDSGDFTGTWAASGKWHPIDFVEGREVFTFVLTGHVNLKNHIGETADFWSECVGLRDADTGSTIRCIWKGMQDESAAYIVLDGRLVEEHLTLKGSFVGGTGKLAGLTGELSFSWSSTHRDNRAHIFTGFTGDLKGVYRLPASGN